MKVFKFYYDDCHTAISGKDELQAREFFEEYVGNPETDKIEEIQESEWDNRFINIYPDNDRSKKPFKVSIRECLEDTPTMIFSNDSDLTE